MNLFADIRALVLSCLTQIDGLAGLPTDAITVEPPRDRGHGDMATNAAMVLAKGAGKQPRETRAWRKRPSPGRGF
jgi:arginyl-tRNA synthetase